MLKSIISELSKHAVLDTLMDILSTIKSEIKHIASNNILEYLSQEYKSCQQTKTLLHRDQPVDLERIYQPLLLQKSYDFRQLEGDVERVIIETLDIKSIFRDSNLVTIIGYAGSGKSTLIKYLFLNTIRTDYKIPIKIELRYLNGTNLGIKEYIINNIIKYEQIAESEQIINRMLISGKFVFFFDGYDELDINIRSNIALEISQLAKKYPQNSYIITSRPTDEINLLGGFYNYQVRRLSKLQITEFVKRQYNKKEQELANKIIESINSKEVDQYRHLLSNPLLLSMFILTYQTDSHIPQKTSDFYAQVFNTLYSGHDTISKLGYRREKRSGLSKDAISSLLERFSFITYWDYKYTFFHADVQHYLSQIKTYTNIQFDSDALIYDLQVSINILIKDGCVYEFPHRSLQEYFAASFVTEQTMELKKQIYELFVNLSFTKFVVHYNFFYLLSELDNDTFKRLFVIPYLDKISIELKHAQEQNKYMYFRALRQMSIIFNKNMHNDFRATYIEYMNRLRSIRNEARIGTRKYMEQQEKIKEELIVPFIVNYDYRAVIEDIQAHIKKDNALGKVFINQIFQRH